MQWRKWRKIASLWRFELDAQSGPMETSDFDDFGKNRQRAGDNGAKSGPLKLDYKRRPYNCEATLLKERSNYILNKRPL